MKHLLLLILSLSFFIAFAQQPVIDSRVSSESDKIFTVVEQMPDFPGGEDALTKFIQKNIRYPEMERQKGIEGRVVLHFIVEKDGSLSDIKVLKGVSAGIDSEAIRVISILPKFKPGRHQGIPVRVQFILPVKFKLPEDSKIQTVVIKEQPVIEEKQSNDTNKVFNTVEQMPEFPGGDEALHKFIQSQLEYPAMEKSNDIQGRVVVRGIVEKDGSYSELVVKKGLSPNIDKEALRILGLLPKFSPGKQQGAPIRVYYFIPIMFKLNSELNNSVQKSSAEANKTADSNAVYSTADQMPEFPGGEDSLQRFFKNRIMYPARDKQNNVHGIVVVKITIEKDGSHTDPSIIKSISPDIDIEALRILSRLPKFKPGINKGKAVRVSYIIPIIFKP
jgi:TonB family protein